MRKLSRWGVCALVLLLAGSVFLLWRQDRAHAQEIARYEQQLAGLTVRARQEENPIDEYFDALLCRTDLELDSYAYTTAGMSAQGWAAVQAWALELEYALDQLSAGPYAQDQEAKDRYLALAEEQDQLLHTLLVMDALPDTAPEERDGDVWLGSMYRNVSQWRLAGLYAQALDQLHRAVSLYDDAPLEYQFDEAVLEDLRAQLFPDDPELALGVLPPIRDVVQ